MRDREQGADSGPTAAVRVLVVPRAAKLVVAFAGSPVGLLAHWFKGRSRPCPGETECVTSVHRGATTWYGYAPVYYASADARAWVPAVLEVTESLEETLRHRNLLGEVWTLFREPGRKRTLRVAGELNANQGCAPRPLRSFDVRPTVQRLYHTSQIQFGAKNPTPDTLHLPVLRADDAAAPADEPGLPDQQKSARETWFRMRNGGERNGSQAKAEKGGAK